jgi:hypothetical protein
VSRKRDRAVPDKDAEVYGQSDGADFSRCSDRTRLGSDRNGMGQPGGQDSICRSEGQPLDDEQKKKTVMTGHIVVSRQECSDAPDWEELTGGEHFV